MSLKFENNETFAHLGEMPPEIKAITDIDPSEVKIDQLAFLDNHLEGLQNTFPDIAKEIDETRNKIKVAMGLGNNIVSGEVMNVAINGVNNEEYNGSRGYRSVA